MLTLRACRTYLFVSLLVNPVVETVTVAEDLNGEELHTESKHGVLLAVLVVTAQPQQGAEVEVRDLLFVFLGKVEPLGLSLFALHLVLVQRLGDLGVLLEFGEEADKVLIELIVTAGHLELAATDLLQNGPVSAGLLNGNNSELLFNVLQVISLVGVEVARNSNRHYSGVNPSKLNKKEM